MNNDSIIDTVKSLYFEFQNTKKKLKIKMV